MPGLMLRSPNVFADSTAPIIPDPPPLPAPIRSYVANAVPAQVGGPITVWPDAAGSGTALTPAGAATTTPVNAPILDEVGGILAARFDGAHGLGQALTLAEPYTLAIAFRLHTIDLTQRTFVVAGGSAGPHAFIESSADAAGLGGHLKWTGSSPFTGMGAPAADQWHVAIITSAGAASSASLSGNEALFTSNSAQLGGLRLGVRQYQPSSPAVVDNLLRGWVESAHLWDRALTAAERILVTTRMLAKVHA